MCVKEYLKISCGCVKEKSFDFKGKILRFTNLNEKTSLSYSLRINNELSYYLIHNIYNLYLCIFFIIFLFCNRYARK